ncbi:Carboxypeptidase D [Manis pentadactyla]|nr:Carboxypeptidase D [Manis pentadactyla]
MSASCCSTPTANLGSRADKLHPARCLEEQIPHDRAEGEAPSMQRSTGGPGGQASWGQSRGRGPSKAKMMRKVGFPCWLSSGEPPDSGFLLGMGAEDAVTAAEFPGSSLPQDLLFPASASAQHQSLCSSLGNCVRELPHHRHHLVSAPPAQLCILWVLSSPRHQVGVPAGPNPTWEWPNPRGSLSVCGAPRRAITVTALVHTEACFKDSEDRAAETCPLHILSHPHRRFPSAGSLAPLSVASS